jgi:hypothetical protein
MSTATLVSGTVRRTGNAQRPPPQTIPRSLVRLALEAHRPIASVASVSTGAVTSRARAEPAAKTDAT